MKNKDITIVFTAYNVLPYLQIAVYSLLHFYPELKENIVIFDDQSTDRTKEWIKKEGLRSITWTYNSLISDIKKHDSFIRKSLPHIVHKTNASFRNSYMIKDVFKQVKTKYLFLCDADIIFLKKGFLETFKESIKKGNRVIAPLEHYDYGWKHYTKLRTAEQYDNFFGKYTTLYYHRPPKEYMKRLHFFFSFIDVGFFKSKNIIFDDTKDLKFIDLSLNSGTLETGSSFSYEIFTRGISYDTINNVFNAWATKKQQYFPCNDKKIHDCYVYHARWLSSHEKMKTCLHRYDLNPHMFDKIKADFSSCHTLKTMVSYIHNTYNTEKPEAYLC